MLTLTQATLSDQERRVVERWVELLAENLDLVAVWLFGSRARGESRPDSDVDLLVIARGEKPWKERGHAYELIYRAAEELGESFLPFSIHLWDPPHLQSRREIRSFFLQEVDRDKIVLFGDP